MGNTVLDSTRLVSTINEHGIRNTPDFSEPLTMLVIIGNSSAQHCFTRVVGIGSRSHDLFRVDNSSLWTSIVVTGWNTTSLGPVYLSSVGGGIDQGWGQVQLTKYSSTPSTPNIYQVQVLVKYSFF